jgi:hypothetical protein
MSLDNDSSNVEEIAIIFHDAESLESAIEELESSGFDRAAISLLASEEAVIEKLGHVYSRIEELEDDETVPRTAFVSTAAIGDAEGALIGGLLYVGALAAAGAVVMSGGTMAAAITAAVMAGGGGAAIGAIMAKWVGNHHAEHIQEQIDKGGFLLWVNTRARMKLIGR